MTRANGEFEPVGPIDWALGTALVESMLKPLHYAVFPDSVDPRDWMTGARASVTLTPKPDVPNASHEDYWFDFVADTGDSDAATYLLACVFEGDIHVADPSGLLAADEPTLPPDTSSSFKVAAAGTDGTTRLPRGDFLFVGGDTAYPVAGAKEIEERFMAPMNAAYEARGKPPQRPLFGIPGNHDWYDSLDGFNRVFRLPALRHRKPAPNPPAAKLDGYVSTQQASYFSLILPGGWELWAMDARDGDDVDFRQAAFFDAEAEYVESAGSPEKKRLILATPNPPFVDGEKAEFTDRFFSELPEKARAAARLWFSGDIHHYERFEDLKLPGASRGLTGVVSGLGGAVLHAAMRGAVAPEKVYPPLGVGSKAVWERLMSPFFMLRRWGFMVLGFALGVALAAGSLAPSGEVGSWVNAALHRSSDECRYPLVLVCLLVTIGTILLKVRSSQKDGRKRAESKVRERSIKERVLWVGIPSLLPPLSLVAIAHLGRRSFGSVMADVAAEVAFLLLLVGAGLGFWLGLPKRTVARSLASFGIAAALTAVCVLVALTCGIATAGALSSLDPSSSLLGAVRAVVPSAAAGALLGVLFPVLAGFALVPAFALGSQTPFISSFAAVDRFQAFIRFRLRVPRNGGESALTGFVIACTAPVDAKKVIDSRGAIAPTAELIDVFTVR